MVLYQLSQVLHPPQLDSLCSKMRTHTHVRTHACSHACTHSCFRSCAAVLSFAFTLSKVVCLLIFAGEFVLSCSIIDQPFLDRA